jgi:hypothetical protein
MMRIADQHLTTLQIKNHLSDSIFCRYTDRDNCLHNMLWYIYSQLELNKKLTLIIDSEKNLKAINYFISRYRLSGLSAITVNSETLKPISDPDNYGHIQPEDKEEVRSRLQQQFRLVEDQIAELTRPCHGDMSIIELNDRQLVQQPSMSHSGMASNLIAKISNADLPIKKEMLKHSQNMYAPSYRHLDKLNPFNQGIIHNDIEGIRSYLSDTVIDIDKLLSKFNDYEKTITEVNNSEVLDKISALRKIHNEINRLKKPKSESYTSTEKVKIEYNLDLIREAIFDDSEVNEDLNKEIEKLSNAFEKYNAVLRAKSIDDAIDLQKKITNHSSDLDIMELYNDTIAIQDNINIAEILSKKYNRKAVSFYNLKVIITDIAKDIDYALFFIDYNSDYLRWNKYYETLPPIDQEIINHFIHEKSSWVDGLDAQLSYVHIEQSLLRLQPMSSSLDGIYDTTQDMINANASFDIDYNNDNISERPLQVYYDSEMDNKYKPSPDSIIVTLNDIPESIEHFNHVKIFAYKEKFDEAAIKRLRSIQDLDIINDTGVYYSINNKLSQLKSHELNMASLYLGQSLRGLSTYYSIFKLKSVAIISYLSEFKNAQLRELLYSEGIKEIFSNVENYNLLPGIFSDTTVKPIILLEDGLINKYNLDTIVRQVIIKEEISVAGIEIMDVDNYRLINNDATMTTFSDSISMRNRDNDASTIIKK